MTDCKFDVHRISWAAVRERASLRMVMDLPPPKGETVREEQDRML